MPILSFDEWADTFNWFCLMEYDTFQRQSPVESSNGKIEIMEIDNDLASVLFPIIHDKSVKWARDFFEGHIQVTDKHISVLGSLIKSGTSALGDEQTTSLDPTTLCQIVRNIHYWDISDTGSKGSHNFTEAAAVQCVWKHKRIPNYFLGKGTRNVIKRRGNIRSALKMFTRKASIFPPETVACIIDRVLECNSLFCPVLGWTSYVLGYAISKAEKMVGVDVNPLNLRENRGVVNEWLHLDNVTIMEGPTEELSKEVVGATFDGVFFSPPYYDRELYKGGKQSYKTFKTYDTWLQGFYLPVLQLCYNVLESGGKMAIVVSDQKVGKQTYPLVNDTKRQASQAGFALAETHTMKFNGCREARGISKAAEETMIVFITNR